MTDLATKLKRLNVAARELATARDEDELLERMLDVVRAVFRRDTAAVLLREPSTKQLRIRASRGYDSQVAEQFVAELGAGVVGRVAETGRSRLVADVRAEPGYVPGVRDAVSEMAVPLTVDGEVLGVLDVESRERAFDDADMALLEAFGEQAAWAMRHGRALASAARRALRLELLNRAARALNAIHDVDELLNGILELAQQALGFANVAILVRDPPGEHLVVLRTLRPRLETGAQIPVGVGITGAVFASGEPELVADVTADARYIPGGVDGARSEMVAPLRLDGEIIGVLDAEGTRTDEFTPLDLEVFSAFAAQVATALNNARLVATLDDRARRLREITQAAHSLGSVHAVDQVLEEILGGATMALGLERAALLLVDSSTAELVVRATRGYRDVVGLRIPMGRSITASVALTGEGILVAEVGEDDRYVPGIEGGASEMAVPLRIHGEVLGVLDSESTVPNAFDRTDLELFQAFADQAAIALHNARLVRGLEEANARLQTHVAEVSRLNRELETYAEQISRANRNLSQQIRQLTALHQAGQAITSSLDLSSTLTAILKMGSELVSSSSGAIKLLDEETKELRVAASAGTPSADDAALTHYDLPLRIGERTIGVFELVRQATDRLGDEDQKLLETLASQAAIAIENARLFEGTQRVYYETLKSLARALEARDPYTRGHSERVAGYCLGVAEELGLEERVRDLVFNAALLHDIGKIGVRDAVLLAPRSLSADELAVIRQHPTFGNVILGPLKFLGEVAKLVKHHHERWDGAGYPGQLRAEEIPLGSRIIAVADAYDAMTSSRPYRDARSGEEALAELVAHAGSQFDPAVVDAFRRVLARSQPAG